MPAVGFVSSLGDSVPPPLAGGKRTSSLLFGSGLEVDVEDDGRGASDVQDLSALLLKMDRADRQLFTGAVVNPLAVKRMVASQGGVVEQDWSKAAWGRIPALDNLKHLSILSRFDIEAGSPPKPSLEGTECIETKIPESTAAPSIIPYVPHVLSQRPHMRESDKFVLSDVGRRVPPAENVRINLALDIRLVRDVQELVMNESAIRSDNISTTILRMRHLLGLGRSQQTLGESNSARGVNETTVDQWLKDVLHRVALAHRSYVSAGGDDLDDHQRRTVEILLQSNLDFVPTSNALSRSRRPESTGSREQRELLRARQPVDHNRGFHSSDVASYPAIRPLYTEEESAAALSVGPPIPLDAQRERRSLCATSPSPRIANHAIDEALIIAPPGGGGAPRSGGHVIPKPPRFSTQSTADGCDASSSSSDEDAHVTRSLYTGTESISATIRRRKASHMLPSMHRGPNEPHRPSSGVGIGSSKCYKTWMQRSLDMPPKYEGAEADKTKDELSDALAKYAAVLERADFATAENRVRVLQHEVAKQRQELEREEAEMRALERRGLRGVRRSTPIPAPPSHQVAVVGDSTPAVQSTGKNLFAVAEVCISSPAGAELFTQMALMASATKERGHTSLQRAERQLALEAELVRKPAVQATKESSTTHSPVRPPGMRQSAGSRRPGTSSSTRPELPIRPSPDDNAADPHLPHCDLDKNIDVDRPPYAPFMHSRLLPSPLRMHYLHHSEPVSVAASPTPPPPTSLIQN